MDRDNLTYIRHIHDAISRIKEYTKDMDHDAFQENNLVQAGVVRELEIIGEATKRLSPEFKGEHPGIPWKKMAGARDKLIHGYFGVDPDEVWVTVERDIPNLMEGIDNILKAEGRQSGNGD